MIIEYYSTIYFTLTLPCGHMAEPSHPVYREYGQSLSREGGAPGPPGWVT